MWTPSYPDNRPNTEQQLEAVDHGVVLRHGDGPNRCDVYGARDVWVWAHEGNYYMHYDAAGDTGWLCALATSLDGIHWTKHGVVLELGAPGSEDSKSASYGVTFLEGETWHMFYLGTPNTSPAPARVPAFPNLTMKAQASKPTGPWIKQPEVVRRSSLVRVARTPGVQGRSLPHNGGIPAVAQRLRDRARQRQSRARHRPH